MHKPKRLQLLEEALDRHGREREPAGGILRSRTEATQRTPLFVQRLRRQREPVLHEDERPKTRADCQDAERPCPFVACTYHLKYDLNRSGNLKDNWPDVELADMPATCALDVAELGGATLDQVSVAINTTRELVRQVEMKALRKLLFAIGPKHKREILEVLAQEAQGENWAWSEGLDGMYGHGDE